MKKMRKMIAVVAVAICTMSSVLGVVPTTVLDAEQQCKQVLDCKTIEESSVKEENTTTETPTSEGIETEPPSTKIPELEEKTYEDLWDDSNKAYIISTVEDLKLFRNSLKDEVNYENKTVYLLNDIRLDDTLDIGTVGFPFDEETTEFQGTFDGRGHSIDGWKNAEEALFLVIGEKGKVCNLTMRNICIDQAQLGSALCYMNEGSIRACAVSGKISGIKSDYASFALSNFGSIQNCISSVDISTTGKRPKLAGIVSSNSGSVSNCIYLGKLSTTEVKKLSLYGIADGNIENCYYLQQNTYKKQVKACSEEELKKQSTYENFDFEHIWKMSIEQNDGYPMLRTDFPELTFITKVPISIEVRIENYTFDRNSKMNACFFPLSVNMEYAGNDENVKKAFHDLVTKYHVTATLREDKWKSDFLVEIPVNGVSRDFSKTDAKDYFDFVSDRNDEYEFDVIDWHYASPSATYYDSTLYNNTLTTEEKNEKIRKAEQVAKSILDSVYQKYGQEAMDNTWFAFTAARANYYPAGTTKDEMFVRLSKVWKEYKNYQKSIGKLPETTETSKFVLAVTALGFDPTDVAGCDLIRELIASDNNGKYFAQHYLAYALYSGRYADYRKYVKSLVMDQMETSKKASFSADDMATMYMQPIFLMYDKKASTTSEDYAIKEYVENEVIPWLQRSITGFGTFYSPYTHCNNNVWTDAQAQMLLALLNADFLSDGFVKNGNTILDYIMEHPETSLEYMGDESQCARALVSLTRCYKGETNLFDCTDVIGVRQIEAMIAALPLNVKESDAQQIDEVQSAFLKLTPGQRNQVDNKSILECAVATLEQIQVDKDIALRMEQRIASIGVVTLEKEALIEQLRLDYNQLTPDQKARVGNYQILLDAEAKLKKLLDAQDSQANKKDNRKSPHKRKDGSKRGDSNHGKVEPYREKKDTDSDTSDANTKETGNGSIPTNQKVDKGDIVVRLPQQSKQSEIKKARQLSKMQDSREKAHTKLDGEKKNMKRKLKQDSIKQVTKQVIGESSLVLNKTLRGSKAFCTTNTFWCYVSVAGVGLFLLAIGIRMSGKEEEVEQTHEKENC